MKKFAALIMILGISCFTLGCGEKPADKPAGDGDKPAAGGTEEGGTEEGGTEEGGTEEGGTGGEAEGAPE